MFSHIRTSRDNKEVVTTLTNKLNLGAENVIARIALVYSLSNLENLSLDDLRDSKGKEYSKNVLFGDHQDVYIGMISNRFELNKSNQDLAKFVKLCLDKGLEELNSIFSEGSNLNGSEFISTLIPD